MLLFYDSIYKKHLSFIYFSNSFRKLKHRYHVVFCYTCTWFWCNKLSSATEVIK